MASYHDTRSLFDDIVRFARNEGILKDEEPFSDAVDLKITPYRTGQLAIDDVGPTGAPQYRVIFMITVDAYAGPVRPHPAPIDLTNDAPEVAFDRIKEFATT